MAHFQSTHLAPPSFSNTSNQRSLLFESEEEFEELSGDNDIFTDASSVSAFELGNDSSLSIETASKAEAAGYLSQPTPTRPHIYHSILSLLSPKLNYDFPPPSPSPNYVFSAPFSSSSSFQPCSQFGFYTNLSFPCTHPNSNCNKINSYGRDLEDLIFTRILSPDEKDYLCGYCDAEFFFNAELTEHLDTFHPPEGPKPPSPKRDDPDMRFVRLVEDDKDYMCGYCDLEFSERLDLTEHLDSVHPL